MYITDCDAFRALRAKVFKMYIETLQRYSVEPTELKGDNPSWVTVDEMRWDDEP
jgi:hypothetical protein